MTETIASRHGGQLMCCFSYPGVTLKLGKELMWEVCGLVITFSTVNGERVEM